MNHYQKNNVRYLSVEQILLIHSMIIDETGGRHGLRDHHAVLALINLPKQNVFDKELYSGVYKKAALYARNIVMNHPFVDGNKRTGMVAASVFLEDNAIQLQTKEGMIESFALEIVSNKLDIGQIASWFKKNCKKLND